jgi:excisionase family DNA binding protein
MMRTDMQLPEAEKCIPPEYLAIPQVAQLTNMSEAYWWKQIRLKRIPYTKFGTAVRVRKSSLDAWLSAREVIQ